MDAARQSRLETAPEKRLKTRGRSSLLTRRRFQFAGALVLGALIPWLLRGPILPGTLTEKASLYTLAGNIVAIGIAFWARLSIETYPGIRRSYVIFPAALTGHGTVLVWFVLTRFPYDRLALSLGFVLHVFWLYLLYVYAERRVRRRIAIVPYGAIDRLTRIDAIDWLTLRRPQLHDARGCHAIVADFSTKLPPEWEAFLADAALAGRVVYQVKQLWESLSGQVDIEHLSENSFGSLVPMRGYFYLKSVIDFCLRPRGAADCATGDAYHRGCRSPGQCRASLLPSEACWSRRQADHHLQVPNDEHGGCRATIGRRS